MLNLIGGLNIPRILKRTLENPATPLSDPAEWLADLGEFVSKTGIRVSPKAAMKFSALWRGINLLATDTAKVPLILYKRKAKGGKEVARTHQSYRLVRRQPNKLMNAFNFWKSRMGHTLIRGNGFGLIIRDPNTGHALEMIPVAPGDVSRVRTLEGKLTYLIVRDGLSWEVPHTDMLHIRGLAEDGVWGYDVVDVGRETIGLGLAANRFSAAFFANNATAGVTITHPSELSPEAKIRMAEDWKKAHTGVDNQHRLTILEEGVKVEKISVDAESAQLMELRAFQLIDIANLIGVPPHKVGDASRKAHASLEQEQRAYKDESLDGWFCQIEAECNDKMLTEKQKNADSHFFEFKREALLSVDHVAKVAAMLNEVNVGTLSVDEARSIMNRSPLPDGLGEGFRIPLGIGMIGDPPKAGESPPLLVPPDDKKPDDEEEDDEETKTQNLLDMASRQLLSETIARMLKRVEGKVSRCTETAEVDRWLDKDLDAHRQAVAVALTPIVSLICCSGGSDGMDESVLVVNEFFRAVREKIETCPPEDLRHLEASWKTDSEILADRAVVICHTRETCNVN